MVLEFSPWNSSTQKKKNLWSGSLFVCVRCLVYWVNILLPAACTSEDNNQGWKIVRLIITKAERFDCFWFIAFYWAEFTVAQREKAQEDFKVRRCPTSPIHIIYERQPQHRDHPTLSNSSWVLLRPTELSTIKELWDGTSGLSSLSEKTRKSDHLQIKLQRQHFLLSYLEDLECWSGRSLLLSTSRVTARCTTNWATWPKSEASRATVKFWGQSFGRGHYPPTYQEAGRGVIYFMTLLIISEGERT